MAAAAATHVGTYNAVYQNPVQYVAQAPVYNQAYLQPQVPLASASGSPAVYRAPFVNRNGVVSRNPDAIWNDPVEHIPLVRPPLPG